MLLRLLQSGDVFMFYELYVPTNPNPNPDSSPTICGNMELWG